MPVDPRINPTTIFMPGQGFGNYGQQMMDAAGANPERREFLIRNPKYDPNDPNSFEPEMIQDPTATANPTAFSNEAGTRGIMNPFGLQWGGDMSRYAGIVPQGAPAAPQAAPQTAPTTQPPAGGEPSTTPPVRPPAGTDANTSGPPELDANGEPVTPRGGGAGALRPPDQRGFEGNYNPTTGLTTYATPDGWFSMDQHGNWTDQQGKAMQFDQSQSGEMGGGGNGGGGGEGGGGGNVTRNGELTGGMGTPGASEYTINGKQYRMTPNGLVEVAGGRNTEGGSAVTSGFTGGSPVPGGPVDPYQRGVTSASIDPKTGKQRFDPTNPYQFGTEASAQGIVNRYGGQAYGQQFTGPGMGLSSPQQMIRYGNQSVNAGLATQALGRPEYGSGRPGSYGDYSVSKDVNQFYGAGDTYGNWARSQPGFQMDPRKSNTGPPAGGPATGGAPPGQQNQQQPMSFEQWQASQRQQPQQNQMETQQLAIGRGRGEYPQYQQQQQQNYQQGGSGGFGGYGGGQQMQAQPYQYPQNNYRQGGRPQNQGGYGYAQEGYQYPQQNQGAQGPNGGGNFGSWGQSGGNSRYRQPQQQQPRPQQGGYSPGQKSSTYQPYGGGYGSYGTTPQANKSGGYMQTGTQRF